MIIDFNKHEFINRTIDCEIYYSNLDLTSLRWLSEVKNIINHHEKLINVKYHPSKSNNIILNQKSIEFHDLKRTIFEFTVKLLEEIREFERGLLIVS